MSRDSKFSIALLVVAGFAMQACVSGPAGPGVLEIGEALSSHGPAQMPHLKAFRQICLSGDKFPANWRARALQAGWTESSDEQLARAGLAGVRKHVLSIPGGGGRFSEEQVLLSGASESGELTISAERKFADGTDLSSTCQMFSKSEFLPSCEALGQAVGRAPDHNQRYPSREAHFIRWDLQMDGLPVTLSCETAPNSPTLAFAGTVLRISIDHTMPARKPTASQPAVDVSGR